MNDQTATDEQQEIGELLVCPGCLHEQEEGPHFCGKCGAPLTAFSTVGPFERIFAQGHAYRRSVSGPTSKIVVIGMWILVLPQFLVLFAFPSLATIPLQLILGTLYGIFLYRVTRNYITHRKEDELSRQAPEDRDATA